MPDLPPTTPRSVGGWPTAPPRREAVPEEPVARGPAGWAPPPPPPPQVRTPQPAPGPAGPAGRRERRALLVALGVVAVMLLLAGILGVGVSRRDDEGAQAPRDLNTTVPTLPSPSTTAAPTTTTPAPPVSAAELDALVRRLQADVSRLRDLPFEADVAVELVPDGEFEARVAARFAEDAGEIERTDALYRALGLLDEDQRLVDELRALYEAAVLGFYDPETDELVVRGASATPYVQQTLVHELVHALDDQHFELHRPEYEERKDELELGFTATAEGDARRTELRWLEEQTEAFRERAEDEEEALASRIDPARFPDFLLFQVGAPYTFGETFVGTLALTGGERGVDAVLVTPPDTSERFLFPQVHQRGEGRAEVPPPPAGGEVVDDGVAGALFWYGLFTTGGSTVNDADAVRAVTGWGGDWFVTWHEGEVACVRADVVGDTPEDTIELRQALQHWSQDRPGATVSDVDGRVRLESCSAGGGAVPPQI